MPRWTSLDSHIGEKYGRLTILEYVGTSDIGLRLVRCKCDCGNETIKNYAEVSKLKVKSCGCLQQELYSTGRAYKTHGQSRTRLYRIYEGMKTRCENPKRREYKNYGGRGIAVCNEWKDDFKAFYRWAMGNGYAENLTIERKDVNKGYSPKNCCWIPQENQSNNKRNTIFLTYNNETKPMSVWARELGVSYWTLRWRKEKGYSDTEAIETARKG